MYATLCCPGSPELQLFLIVIDKVFIRITLLFYVARCLLLGVCCLLWLFVVRSLLLTVDCNQRYLILFLLIQLTYCYCCLFVVYLLSIVVVVKLVFLLFDKNCTDQVNSVSWSCDWSVNL